MMSINKIDKIITKLNLQFRFDIFNTFMKLIKYKVLLREIKN